MQPRKGAWRWSRMRVHFRWKKRRLERTRTQRRLGWLGGLGAQRRPAAGHRENGRKGGLVKKPQEGYRRSGAMPAARGRAVARRTTKCVDRDHSHALWIPGHRAWRCGHPLYRRLAITARLPSLAPRPRWVVFLSPVILRWAQIQLKLIPRFFRLRGNKEGKKETCRRSIAASFYR